MSNLEKDSSELLEKLSSSLEKISNALVLNTLMEYRKKIENNISEIITSEAKKGVWELCDGTNNVRGIAKILGLKSHSTVSEHIKSMLEEGIIFKNQVGKETYPINIDALMNILLKNSISI